MHHRNHNRLDPRVLNLEVLDNHEHHMMHNRGSNNSTAKLTEKEVEEICKDLQNGKTHKEIATKMTAKTKKFISVDSIDKISNGTNWTHVTKKYKLKKEKRETMNEFSDRAVEIARMKVVEELSNKEIAKRLNIDPDSKSYQRLVGCIPRYVKNFNEGVYGLFRRQN